MDSLNAADATTREAKADGRIVTIARFDQPAQAHIARAQLEASGIPAMVAGENNPGMFVFHAFIGLSVELQVFDSDAEQAIAILKGAEDSASDPGEPAECASAEPPEEQEGEEPDASKPTCPACGSERLDAGASGGGWKSAFALLAVIVTTAIATLPLLGLARRRRAPRRCLDCGHAWQEDLPSPGAPGARAMIGRGVSPY